MSAKTAYYPNDEELNQAFLDYVRMRKEIKKPLTERAVKMAMTKLQNLSDGDNDLAIQILEQSIFNCWLGVFPLREETKSYACGNQRNQPQSREAKFERLMQRIKEDKSSDD